MPPAFLRHPQGLGASSLSREYCKLAGLVERLCDQFEEAESANRVKTSAILGACYASLYERVAAHFVLEESLMRHGKYPHYAAHKADHERLLGSIRLKVDACKQNRCAFCSKSIRACLEDWFIAHVYAGETVVPAHKP